MEIIETPGWPWSELVQIEGNVYQGGHKVLELQSERPPVMTEHGWTKGTTWYFNNDLHIQYKFKISRKVFNLLRKRIKTIIILDYRHKLKHTWKMTDLIKSREKLKIKNGKIILPLDRVEEYVPNYNYKKYGR